MIDVPVKLGARSYRVAVGAGLLAQVGPEISRLGVGRKLALLTDPAIKALYGEIVARSLAGAGFEVTTVLLPEGERAKTLEVAAQTWDRLLEAGLDRGSAVVALGGGAVGDLAGFVAGSCRLKASVIERDEQETELRHVLNYGHTIGHAIEAVTGYARFAHGEAVSLGMVAEAGVAERLGLAATETRVRQVHLLETMGLPVREVGEAPERVIEAMARDKKGKEGRVPFVLAPEIGRFRIVFDVPKPVILEALAELG